MMMKKGWNLAKLQFLKQQLQQQPLNVDQYTSMWAVNDRAWDGKSHILDQISVNL